MDFYSQPDPVNVSLYHYAGNNPVKFSDPTGMWTDNEDGSWTAESGDTLYGLTQITGKDWRDTDYSGKPEDLQIGQKVSYSYKDNIEEFVSNTGDFAGPLAALFKELSGEGFTASTSSSLPLPTLGDPDLLTLSSDLDKIGNAALGIGIAINIYDGVATGIETKSFWHGAFKTAANLVATAAGYGVGLGVTAFLTSATVGVGSVPAAIVGTAAGTGTSCLISLGFEHLENAIWKQQ